MIDYSRQYEFYATQMGAMNTDPMPYDDWVALTYPDNPPPSVSGSSLGTSLPGSTSPSLSDNTLWKPNFNNANPWEGMPADYPKTFVPITGNVLAPWTGQVVKSGDNPLVADDTGKAITVAEYNKKVPDINRISAETAKALFEKDNVRLGDGAYIPKTTYDRLSSDLQDIATKQGVDALVKGQGANSTQYTITNGDKSVTLSQSEYDTYQGLGGKDRFDYLKAKGLFGAKDEFVSVDAQGHLKFTQGGAPPNAPSAKDALSGKGGLLSGAARGSATAIDPDVVAELKGDKKPAQPFWTPGQGVADAEAAGVVDLSKYKGTAKSIYDFKNLTAQDQQRVATFETDRRATLAAQNSYIDQNFGKIVLGFVPVVGTIVNWNDMSTGWKAVSIATDVLTFVPVSRITELAKLGNIARDSKLARAIEGATAGMDASRNTLNVVAPDTLPAFDNVIRAQTDYTTRLNRVKQIQTVLDQTPDSMLEDARAALRKNPGDPPLQKALADAEGSSLRPDLEKMLEDAQKGVEPARQKVIQSGEDLIDAQRSPQTKKVIDPVTGLRTEVKGTIGGYDDALDGLPPAQIRSMPQQLAQSVETSVAEAWNPSTRTLKMVNGDIKATSKAADKLAKAQESADRNVQAAYQDWSSKGKPDTGTPRDSLLKARSAADSNAAKLSESRMKLFQLTEEKSIIESGDGQKTFNKIQQVRAQREGNALARRSVQDKLAAITKKYADFPDAKATELENSGLMGKLKKLNQHYDELGKEEVSLRNQLREALNKQKMEYESAGRGFTKGGGTAVLPKTARPIVGGSTGTASVETDLAKRLRAPIIEDSRSPSGASSIQADIVVTATPGEIQKITTTANPSEKTTVRPKTSGNTNTDAGSQDDTDNLKGTFPKTGTVTTTDTGTKGGVKPVEQTETKPETSPQEEVKTKTTTETKVERKPDRKPPLSSNKTKDTDKATGWTQEEIKSATGWKQGLGYWLYKAPYRHADRKFVLQPPAGMKIEPDMKTAVATIQTLTGKPAQFTDNLGIVNFVVKNPGREPGGGGISFAPSHVSVKPAKAKVEPKPQRGHMFTGSAGRGQGISAKHFKGSRRVL